jgi:hypothetical protein
MSEAEHARARARFLQPAALLLVLLVWAAFFQGGLGSSPEALTLGTLADELHETGQLPDQQWALARAWPAYGATAVLQEWIWNVQWRGAILPALLALLCVGAVAETCRRGQTNGLTALLLAGTAPALVAAASRLSIDLPVATVGAFALYLLRGVDEDQPSGPASRLLGAVLSGIAVALAGVVHPAFALAAIVLLPLSLAPAGERAKLPAGLLVFAAGLGLVGNLWVVAWRDSGGADLLTPYRQLAWTPGVLGQDLQALLRPTGVLGLAGWFGLAGLVAGRDERGCRRAATWLLLVATARTLGAGGDLAPLLYLPGLAVGAGALAGRAGRLWPVLPVLGVLAALLLCAGRLDTVYNRLDGLPAIVDRLPGRDSGKLTHVFPDTQARLRWLLPHGPEPLLVTPDEEAPPAELLACLRAGDVLLLSPRDAAARPELHRAILDAFDRGADGCTIDSSRIALPGVPPPPPGLLLIEGPVPPP